MNLRRTNHPLPTSLFSPRRSKQGPSFLVWDEKSGSSCSPGHVCSVILVLLFCAKLYSDEPVEWGDAVPSSAVLRQAHSVSISTSKHSEKHPKEAAPHKSNEEVVLLDAEVTTLTRAVVRKDDEVRHVTPRNRDAFSGTSYETRKDKGESTNRNLAVLAGLAEVSGVHSEDGVTPGATTTVPCHGGKRNFPDQTSLHLLGERHSGTKWISKHLQDCFDHKLDFIKGLYDWKHWFQNYQDNNNTMEASSTAGSVVIAQFRNVFDWTEAMRFHPYNAPDHYELGWREFVTKPWTMPRYGEDIIFENTNATTSPKGIMCHNRISNRKRPHQVIPCLANQTFWVEWNGIPSHKTKAFYELRNDGSGLRFNSVLELRSAKIRNFLSAAQFPYVRHFYIVRYEDLVKNGTEPLIRQLEQDLNVTAKCKPIPGTPLQPQRPLSEEYLEYMKLHVDWQTESLIGYQPVYDMTQGES